MHDDFNATISEIHNLIMSAEEKTDSPKEVCIILYNAEDLINNVNKALKYKDMTLANIIPEQIRVSSL